MNPASSQPRQPPVLVEPTLESTTPLTGTSTYPDPTLGDTHVPWPRSRRHPRALTPLWVTSTSPDPALGDTQVPWPRSGGHPRALRSQGHPRALTPLLGTPTCPDTALGDTHVFWSLRWSCPCSPVVRRGRRHSCEDRHSRDRATGRHQEWWGWGTTSQGQRARMILRTIKRPQNLYFIFLLKTLEPVHGATKGALLLWWYQHGSQDLTASVWRLLIKDRTFIRKKQAKALATLTATLLHAAQDITWHF